MKKDVSPGYAGFFWGLHGVSMSAVLRYAKCSAMSVLALLKSQLATYFHRGIKLF